MKKINVSLSVMKNSSSPWNGGMTSVTDAQEKYLLTTISMNIKTDWMTSNPTCVNTESRIIHIGD